MYLPVAGGAAGTVEPFTLRTSDGLHLVARWRRGADSPLAAVVLVHGFCAGQDDDGIQTLAETLRRSRCDVLTYDARGHGRSDGDCALGSQEHLDVMAALDATVAGSAPVVLVGVSMGAVAVVSYLAGAATAPAVVGAVLVSAPARWRMPLSAVGLLAAVLTRTGPGRWVAARRMQVRVARRWQVGEAPAEAVRRVRLPLAVVHGSDDRLLPVAHGRLLRGNAGGRCCLDEAEGMAHGIKSVVAAAHVVAGVHWVLAAG